MCTGCLKTNSFTATVAMRPRAMRPAIVPPAMSTCDMIQPPKMSPFWFASAGIGMTRSDGCLPSGSLSVAGGSFSMLHKMERAAAEGGEAGAEDEAGVDEIRVGDDPFLQHALGFIEIGREELLAASGPVCVRRGLHRLAVLPAVDSLAAFLAKLARVDFALEDLRHLDRARRLGERLARVQADVEADGVGELGGAHRHAEGFHRGVDRLGLHAFVDQSEGILHIRPKHSV